MKLKHHHFNIPPDRMIERDTEGRFYLHDGTGKRKILDRDESRKMLNFHILNNENNELQFTHGSIGEQWFGHREFFEHGKEYVRIAHNEISRDWKKTFDLVFPETHRTTAFNFLRGVELVLKAYMLFKDERLLPIDLKGNYGHDLSKLLIDASNMGLKLERCVVIPYDDQYEEEHLLGAYPQNTWMNEVFGNASNVDERRCDIAIGVNCERYALKGTEYPISVYEEQELYYLANIAGFAYTLYSQIRTTDGFFDHKRWNRHGEFDAWLQELHSQRKKHILSEEEVVEQLAELDRFFDKCNDLPGPEKEPDWEEQRKVIEQAKVRGASNT